MIGAPSDRGVLRVVVLLLLTADIGWARQQLEVFVDPVRGNDDVAAAAGFDPGRRVPLRTVHAARDAVRVLRAEHPGADITVSLLSGVHHVGGRPLRLGGADGGADGAQVTWRSADPANPAVIGAPIRITGWLPHPDVKGALIASVAGNPNITKTTPLRQLWVDGQRAERPKVYGHGRQPGDNRNGHCLNLTNTLPTPMYPTGSAFDFRHENATDPTRWKNPADVEFVYTSCDAINCWIEPRCTVESVEGKIVKLKQSSGNSSCFHRLYFYAQCFNNGKGPGRTSARGNNPTHLENVAENFTAPGQWYYDRAESQIWYMLRPGETAATVEATATTATQQELVVVSHTQNLRFVGIRYEYATWLGASGPRGYIDTQSAYLCQDGEPPVNVHVAKSTNVSFMGCTFQHLGAVYALGADQGSQQVVVSNCTFLDISGGGVKLGSSGERGAPAPSVSLDPSLQDRGFLVSDNLLMGIPREFSGANPIFGGYVADTSVSHNEIHDSTYSGVCMGWGWGMPSYVRNIRVDNNSITKPMQRLADGGGVYTNTPCLNCHVSGNYFASDPAVYGCLYHDGGSGLWNDVDNVFNHITSHIVFAHGNSKHTTVNRVWYNDSEAPNLQGDTNRDVRDASGKCTNVSIVDINNSLAWPVEAQAIIANAGRRAVVPTPVAPALSPPAAPWPPHNYTECNTPSPGPPRPAAGPFVASPCKPGEPSQEWTLSKGVAPGDGQSTNVQMAAGSKGCWEITACAHGPSAAVGCSYGCKPLPKPDVKPKGPGDCNFNGVWALHTNGTITSVMDGNCLQTSTKGGAVNVGICTGGADQKFKWQVVNAKPKGHPGPLYTVTQVVAGVELCVQQSA